LSIIVPTYREADNIRPLIARIRAALDGQVDYEVVFVDDNSPDETVARVEEARQQGAPARLIVRQNERGLSSAVMRGFREARGDLLLCMDADLSHPPEAIPKMLEAQAQSQAEIVVGSRYVPGGSTEKKWGWYRQLNSQVARYLAWPLTAVRDNGAGFFLLPRAVFARAQNLSPVGYKAALEIQVKCRCHPAVEVPIHFSDRQFGESKLNLRQQWLYLVHLKRLYDYRFGGASRFVQFCLVGSTGLVFDLATYALLLHAGLPLKLARALAIWVALTWNFFLNRQLTFDLYAHHPLLPQYFRFVLTCLVGALVNLSVSVGLVKSVAAFHGHLYLAAIAGIIAGTVFNFALSFLWVFRGELKPPGP
jgi:dolichol-phosphate mannosyltransferase